MAVSTTHFSQTELEFAKLLKCVQVEGKKTMCWVARQMYSSSKMKTMGGAMTLNKYMKANGIKVDFGDVGNLLNCNIMNDNNDFDVTFAYTVVTKICKDLYEDLSDPCKNRMSTLINLRNDLCHVYVYNRDIKHIKASSRSLSDVLNGIYAGVAKVLNKDKPKSAQVKFDSNAKMSIHKIMEAKVHPRDRDYLDEFKKEVKIKVIDTAFSDICKYCDKLKLSTLDPCSWTDEKHKDRFDLEKVFTTPDLECAEGQVEMSKLLTVTTDVGGKQEIPRAIVLQGNAGCGKTSFCRFLQHSWIKGSEKLEGLSMEGLSKCHLVLLVEVRRTSSGKLEEYLREQLLKETFKSVESEDVMRVLSELEILFVIDGYDECNKKSSDLVGDIFKKFGSKRMILTTRTNTKEEVVNITKRYKVSPLVVNLKGFCLSSRKDYTTKVFMGMHESPEMFEKYLEGRGKVLETHLTLPLTVALLIVLWMDNPDNVNNVTTATSLYHELFKLFQRKLQERLITLGKSRGADELLPILGNLLLSLGEKAWCMLKDKEDCRLNDELRETIKGECRKKKIDHEEFLCAFLKCEIDEDGDTPHHEYHFLHRTQTEYLASLFLSSCIMKGKKLEDVAEEVEDWKQYDQLLVYLTGNMALNEMLEGRERELLELVEKAEIEPCNYSYWWNIVSESVIKHHAPAFNKPVQYISLVHPDIGRIIAFDERFLSSHVAWSTDSKDVAAALRLIALIPVEVESLNIEIPENVEPTEIPDFLEALEEVKLHYSRRVIRTELVLWRHYSKDHTSERILLATKPWAELVTFTGSLREHISNFHKKFPKLKNIRCKAVSPDALKSFKFLSSVRVLRIMVGFSTDSCSSASLPDLSNKGLLEICVDDLTDGKIEGALTAINNLSGNLGCNKLHLEKSEVSYEAMEKLIENLQGRIHHSLTVKMLGDRDEEKEKDLDAKAKFTINWS